MKYVYALIVALTILPGCAKKLTPATPVAAAAMKADAVVIRVNELQAAVIEFCGLGSAAECQPNTIPTATAREIVKGLIDVRATLRAVPAGWQATVKATWARVKARLSTVTNPAVLSAMALVNAAVEGL
jgi:hypothetical protein